MKLEEIIYSNTHHSWHSTLIDSLQKLDRDYIKWLESSSYLPSDGKIFNAFKNIPKDRVGYILFGQDPYPRKESATGYAFIDGRVKNIFSSTGLSKEVNKATSLRNFIKMLLYAQGLLECKNTSQSAIASIDKQFLIDSIDELRVNMENQYILLLNSALVFEDSKRSKYHTQMWKPFIDNLLSLLKDQKPTLILFGNYSKELLPYAKRYNLPSIVTPHPYNTTFICNQEAVELFRPMELLVR